MNNDWHERFGVRGALKTLSLVSGYLISLEVAFSAVLRHQKAHLELTRLSSQGSQQEFAFGVEIYVKLRLGQYMS